MKYSAIIELVGIRELATDSPSDYIQKIREFRFALESSYDSDSSTNTYIFRDSCYLEDASLPHLVKFIRSLRTTLLLRSSLVVRGAIAKGSLSIAPIKSESPFLTARLQGFECGSVASQLFGFLERLKGVGIFVANSVYDDSGANLDNAFFDNCYVSESRYNKYIEFVDLSLDSEFMTWSNLGKLLSLFSKARFFSKKIARFYIPILVNWAKHMNLGPRSEENLDLDDYIVNKRILEKCRDVLGIELVFLALMDRVFSAPPMANVGADTMESVRTNNLRKYFRRSQWLHRFIMTDSKTMNVPSFILRGLSRRHFAEELG